MEWYRHAVHQAMAPIHIISLYLIAYHRMGHFCVVILYEVEASPIPKPKQWGGYRLKPEIFEFWQGQQSHLHNRIRYTPEVVDGKRLWKIDRLAP
ncbi:hypothetical protein ACSBR1_012627 [Camellia fascicularis]